MESDQISGGALEGLLRFQDNDLAKIRTNINNFVAGFANELNHQLYYGRSSSASDTGSVLFTDTNAPIATDPPTYAFTATSIQLSGITAGQIAASTPCIASPGVPKGIAGSNPIKYTTENQNKGTMAISSMTMRATSFPTGANPPLQITFGAADGSGYTYTVKSTFNDNTYYQGTWHPGESIKDSDTAPTFELQIAGSPVSGDSIAILQNNAIESGNGNALSILALRDKAFISLDADSTNATVTDAYSQLIGDLGVLVQSGKTEASISSTLETNANQTLASTNGVNLDEEAARLIQYQQSYQAAAKVLQVAQKIFDTLLNTTA